MHKFILGVLLSLFAMQVVGAENANEKENRLIIGTIENVLLDEADVIMKARIDTGAGLASINAKIVEIKKGAEGGTERVVFQVEDKEGKKKTLERNVVKWINIKKKGDTGFIRRPVVKMDFCLGGKKVDARVNLADRSGFLYPMLIGRNVLKAGDYMIDPEKTFIHEPSCK